MFSLICVWINGWVNNREAGDLRRYLGHYDVSVMNSYHFKRPRLVNYDRKMPVTRAMQGDCETVWLNDNLIWNSIITPEVCFHVYSWWRHRFRWKHFPRYWPFVRGIHRSPVNSPHKGQWRGALMFSLICAWIKGWVNTREAGYLRRHRAHHDVTVMCVTKEHWGLVRIQRLNETNHLNLSVVRSQRSCRGISILSGCPGERSVAEV